MQFLFPRIIIATFAPDEARPTDRRAKTHRPMRQDPPTDEAKYQVTDYKDFRISVKIFKEMK